MILAQSAGPGTYGPFSVAPGSYLMQWSASGTSGNMALVFTDELGNTANIGGATFGANQSATIAIPAGSFELIIPATYSGANVTISAK